MDEVQIIWRRVGGKQWEHPEKMPRAEALELIKAISRIDKKTWGIIQDVSKTPQG
jgi:hypothetical protein